VALVGAGQVGCLSGDVPDRGGEVTGPGAAWRDIGR
jgi:hypothetical protein